jgi:hypothetical protein
MEHQEYARDRKNDEEEKGDSSQAERISESKAMAFDLCREDVEKEVVVDQHGSFQIGIRYSSSEDGSPKC